jgi:hypothetical protein
MNEQDNVDRSLGEALREVAPQADFDSDAIRERIEASLQQDGLGGYGGTTRSRSAWWVWPLRIAAAVSLFVGGGVVGRATMEPMFLQPVVPSYIPGTATPSLLPSEIPFAIQAAGTQYIASLALLSELQDRLTPLQLDQARQAAVAVLSGAIAELRVTDDARSSARLLRTLLSLGVPTGGPGDPIVRYP